MKKQFLTVLLLILIGGFQPSYSNEDTYDSFEEYEKMFEMGFFEDEESVDTEEEQAIKPHLKEKANLEGKDVIKPEFKELKLKTGKADNIDVYKEEYKRESGRNDLVKNGKFTVYSESTKENRDQCMKTDLKSTVNASYKVNKNVDLRAGQEVWYVNPRLNVTDNMYLDYTGKYNESNKNLEQEVGVNVKPKVFKDNASFGVKAGTTINEEGETQSQKLKFTTDFYLF